MGRDITHDVNQVNEYSHSFNAMLKTIKENCSPLNIRIFNSCPELVVKSMKVCEDNADKYDDYARNILCFSMLAAFGICFPTVRIAYGTSHHSINPSESFGRISEGFLLYTSRSFHHASLPISRQLH